MRILHVTPHLPPDQAANALLPAQLGEWAAARGDSVHYFSHPARTGESSFGSQVTWFPRTEQTMLQRTVRVGSIVAAWKIRMQGAPFIRQVDLVHLHSNGILTDVCAAIARQLHKPTILTLYGTEIWHYRPKRWGPDLFTRAYRGASAITFYSQGLLDRARDLGLDRAGLHVIYPPVAAPFQYHDAAARQAARAALGITARHLLLNVKRLHPLAGQRHLLEALPAVLQEHPDTHLVICGTGTLLPELQAVARSAGVQDRVTFAGLVDNATVARYCAAADLFILPSLLEALPTVAVEALASGTPVIAADNPGGIELNALFGGDVQVVPRERPAELAAAIRARLRSADRTSAATRATVDQRFRPAAVERHYRDLYADVTR